MANAAESLLEIMKDFKYLAFVWENPIFAAGLAVFLAIVGLIAYALSKRTATNEKP